MPFEIIRNDIAKMKADAIVNTANPQPVIGAGTDSMIHAAAGPRLLKARQKIGPIPVGDAAVTPAFRLQAKYVIHTVGPVWEGGNRGEEALLQSCFDRSLELALAHRCQSVAFPLISTGTYGFPKDKALQIAIAAFSRFLTAHEMQIYLVVFDRSSFQLSERLFRGVASYIDENYVQAWSFERSCPDDCSTADRRRTDRRSLLSPRREAGAVFTSRGPQASPHRKSPELLSAPSKAMSLEEMLRQQDAGFSETLLKLIDQRGKKDSEVYKKANLSKQHFSKIRNNPHYRPTKATAVALAIALELDLTATRDLIGRAGYALTNSSKFDLIIRYFIEQKHYDVMEINLVLYEFDQPLLGAGA